MGRFAASRVVERGKRSVLCGLLSALGCSFAMGQAKVTIDYETERLPVVAMDGSYPMVEVQGKLIPVFEGQVSVVPANRYTDGAVDVLKIDAMMGQDYGSSYGGHFFRFDATVRAERDFENCFILFVIAPETGAATYVMREIADINAVGNERILVTMPVNPGFGGGRFSYKLFSGGEEIEVRDPNGIMSIRDESQDSFVDGESGEPETDYEPIASSRENRSSAVGAPPKVEKARLLDFPKSLLGVVAGGYAVATFSIDEKGEVIEILSISGDRAEFIPEVWKTVTQSRYRPGIYQGKALVTTVRQTYFFNEFAPFSEEMVSVPYPNLRDRAPRVIYSPLPEIALSKARTVELEITVNRLGRVENPMVVDDSGRAEVGAAALQAIKQWIFEPAIVDGFPVEQRFRYQLKLAPQ
ncbi:TonB family protein [Pelagicoccus sp. SDUM812003]|uniref:TonB family protein n=1 Tax=Pelagicoccus sp. SDUM812003 TaxID=3041267 RepID=UPI00280FA6C2|nr:TonB family protein [Pelagicoccus sp. SDUM812003]MDQ8203864.1 TonB family protein [Pelagicoccus sp. SDUM812003]